MADTVSTPQYDLGDFSVSQQRIEGPSKEGGYSIPVLRGNQDDSARYLLEPDTEFYRPWIANPPNGSAFIWPGGIQGFNISSTSTLGIHHYIGEVDIDVDVIYPSEEHITLTGHFPGKKSVNFLQRLKKVLLEKTSEAGKVLALPLVEERILYVAVSNYAFTHDENDNTDTVGYSIDLVRVGVGGKLILPTLTPPKNNAQAKKKKKGKSAKKKTVSSGGGGGGSLRSLAMAIYGNTSVDAQLQIIKDNQDNLEAQGIQAFTLPITSLGNGVELEY